MKDIINDNYKSTVARGLINSNVIASDFICKLHEELAELEDALFEIESSVSPTRNLFDNFNEELADVILVALNCAKHFEIDIEKELKKKVKKNFNRANISSNQTDIFDLGA